MQCQQRNEAVEGNRWCDEHEIGIPHRPGAADIADSLSVYAYVMLAWETIAFRFQMERPPVGKSNWNLDVH